MKRIYLPYWLWEDYNNGMYNDIKIYNESDLIEKCIGLLTNRLLFEKSINLVFKNWPNSTIVNLTNNNQNIKSWIGAAACNYVYNAQEYITRLSWAKLNDLEKYEANYIARLKIIEWQNDYLLKNKKSLNQLELWI